MLSLTNDKLDEYKSALASQLVQTGEIVGDDIVRVEKEDEGIYKELKSRMDKLN